LDADLQVEDLAGRAIMAANARVIARIQQQLKRYKSILADAKSRDLSESDTVRIIADMLADMLGYDKYSEITTEFAIRNTYVDLAVRANDEVRFLIEAKAVGETLKETHVKQAIDYAANQGVEWVVLTNAIEWQVYKVQFKQPIEKVLVFSFNLMDVTPRDEAITECLATLSREGFTQSSMSDFYQAQQAISRFMLAAFVLSDPMVTQLRKEIRRKFSGVRVDEDLLRELLATKVLKREVVESEEATRAAGVLKKAARAAARARQSQNDDDGAEAATSQIEPSKAEDRSDTEAPVAPTP
jgi:hypothetical protein